MRATAATRELVDGLHWIPACSAFRFPDGTEAHSHVSTYLVVGDDAALLIDAGHPANGAALIRSLHSILGDRPLDYVMPTHPEMPHAGCLPLLVAHYPDIQVCGDTRDYHLYFPEIAHRLVPMSAGERIDLGSKAITLVPAAIRDLPNTLWAYEEATHTMFVSDGFGYAHHHSGGECTLTSAELPERPSVAQTAFLHQGSMAWTRYGDLEPYLAEYDELERRYVIDIVAPAHGAVIVNPAEILPIINEGFRTGHRSAREALAKSR